MSIISFCQVAFPGREKEYVADFFDNPNHLADGKYTHLSQQYLQRLIHSNKVLLTNSCTSALEMAAILADIQPGDEIIMPSFTFPSTANAFVLRGGVPVFVDIREDTLNMDERLIEKAITPKTKAIVPVHYAGVACDMETIGSLAKAYNLTVIEDAAQSVMSAYQGKPVGSQGDLSAFSFHYTKNITSGFGGCLCINNDIYSERADIVFEKGTNRKAFFQGKVDQYTWVDVGSSYQLSELMAAVLFAQLEKMEEITASRMMVWNRYHRAFEAEALKTWVRRPMIPSDCVHNAHIYYLLLPGKDYRDRFIDVLSKKGIDVRFHFMPLHNSPAGIRYSRSSDSMENTQALSQRLVRLPLWFGIDPYIDDIISTISHTLRTIFNEKRSTILQ